MSWLFGIRKDNQIPPESFTIPQVPDFDGAGGSSSNSGDDKKKGKGSTAFANFDSRPFEIAAKAVKELEQSSMLKFRIFYLIIRKILYNTQYVYH